MASNKNNNNSTGRYLFIFILISLYAAYILVSAVQIMLPPQRDYWIAVSEYSKKRNLTIPATRGNILSCDGKLLAGSIPEYRLFIDFHPQDKNDPKKTKEMQHWVDSVFKESLDSLSLGLAQIFPDKTAAWFKKRLLDGKNQTRSRAWRIYPKNATYIQYQDCKNLPFFREGRRKSGFYGEEILQRKKPYGSLASRTIGELYRDTAKAKCGLEESFDSILSGKPGKGYTDKLRNTRVEYIEIEPQDGHDLLTTIDVGIQDVAEKALRKKLTGLEGTEVGIAIVMEVATGDVKAIVNLSRGADGNFYEMKNNAISDLMEPGSTFKTASIMVGLEDGVIDKNMVVDCKGGVYPMHGRLMKDHSWRKGGYHDLTVSQILEQSSNIGVSRLIDEAYHSRPQDFVDGLRRMGVGIPLNLPFKGKGEPIIPQPNSKKRYWSNTDLPWMSIGYVTMLTPIHTLAFYNGIANNGRMLKPRFVKSELANGTVVRHFPTEVLVEKMCSQKTIDEIHVMLENVVGIGLGKAAGNGGRYFKVSGKTGTAQMAARGGKGYHSGTPRYMVSFCGFYPSEAPQYSTIVCIVKNGLPASGGLHCGPVFKEISQYVMSQGVVREIPNIKDSILTKEPIIARGNVHEAKQVLSLLDAEMNEVPVDSLEGKHRSEDLRSMPNVVGMGAKTAMYVLRQRNLNVLLSGAGRVVSQSIPAGARIQAGESVDLVLK